MSISHSRSWVSGPLAAAWGHNQEHYWTNTAKLRLNHPFRSPEVHTLKHSKKYVWFESLFCFKLQYAASVRNGNNRIIHPNQPSLYQNDGTGFDASSEGSSISVLFFRKRDYLIYGCISSIASKNSYYLFWKQAVNSIIGCLC
jgi:hypothetical protein